MRPRKYSLSERAGSPNCATFANIVSLGAAVRSVIKAREAADVCEARQAESPRRPGDQTSRGTPAPRAEIGREKRRQPPKRTRLPAADLQKVLDCSDVATLLLDAELTIRFFTPATKLLFDIIPGDIGRRLTDLSSLARDGELVSDIRTVQRTLKPIEREIEARSGAWYLRRILPYRSEDEQIEGIVLTFADISHQKETTTALERARLQAEAANVAKSRFLAAASHDLRQPLQTLVLLQELLAKIVVDDKAKTLVGRLDQTLNGMAEMLDALLDINQIEAGTIRTEQETFRIDDVLDRVTSELACQAEAQRIALRMVPCKLSVHSDPRLLEQMIRNLVSNALKYTKRGRVLVGCRRRNGRVSIEIWDTGVGIPEGKIRDIFEEYQQLDNSARDRRLGLGLGLSIVKRLGILLDHPVTVRSQFGRGSAFSIEVKQADEGTLDCAQVVMPGNRDRHLNAGTHRTVLIVEGDLELRDLLRSGLSAEGHQVAAASDGAEALGLVTRDALRPHIVISDFNLANGMDGLAVAAGLRASLRRSIPVIILTGDISTKTLRDIAGQKCEHLNKPTSLKALYAAIERLAPMPATQDNAAAPDGATAAAAPTIYVVDDDRDVRQAIRGMLEHAGRFVEDFESGEAFLNAYCPGGDACLLIDANLPGMSGLAVLKQLKSSGRALPAIMITGQGDVPLAVDAMKAGAADFIAKPIRGVELLAGVERALELSRDSGKLMEWRQQAVDHIACLTARQRQIMTMVLAGHLSKNIAADLGISQRTVENHRASIMKKAGVRSLPALARLALAATGELMTGTSLATIPEARLS